ncbi:MAG: putative 2-aminoethylphosphonate ABC transporter ATP-binding protein [Hyphomicrobiaceae bacterium]
MAQVSAMHEAAKQANPYLQISNLSKLFGGFTALKDIALTINEGEFVCFLGPSGCGKTTLLRAIAGLDIQTTGTIVQAGKDISNLPSSERDFGIVFQSYALFPNLKVSRNVAYGLENMRLPRGQIRARVQELLELVGLSDQGDKYPAQLSGGQQQRVALARALATSPGLLLLDEPLSALDARVRSHLRHEIKQLQHQLGVTTIMVTHDQVEALTMADRIVVMNHGVIEQVATPVEVYREPTTLFVADFIGEMNKVPCTITGPDQVKLGRHHLRSREHGLVVGTSATMAIRPEDIVPHGDGALPIGQADARDEPSNAMRARIGEMEFLGSFWRALLVDGDIGNTEMFADFSINAVRRMGLAEGIDIEIELPAERVNVFSESD